MKTLCSLLLCACVCAGEIRITGGAADDQVFQRSGSGSASIPLSGTTPGKNGDAVEARLVRKHVVMPGFDWTAIARVSAGAWSGELKNVPAGGPYRVEIRSAGSNAAVNNLLVGDLWVLAGQSNMQGVGDLADLEMPHELVHNFDMADRWVVAEEPLHSLQTALDPVHWAKGQTAPLAGEALQRSLASRRKGAGLGLPFAVEMVKRTGVPIGLLSCAHGGTSMDQWDPALRNKAGESLYGSMYRRVKAAGGRVTGVLWYQGESDANPKAAPVFLQKFERLVSSIREDFGLPELPFYYVQIGRHVNDSNVAEWNLVQDMQRRAEKTISRAGMATAADLSLDDGIHVSTPDLKRLGRRFANLATNPARPGPRPASAKFDNGIVRVAFSGVNGRLQAPGRLSGFSVHSAEGALLPLIYKMRVDPADPSAVLLHVGGKIPSGATLRYGSGKDPYCNLRDSADMALPVFQGVAIE
ncbi:MAG: sialate O-acetylesterase [Bryobacteraceae bacterium]